MMSLRIAYPTRIKALAASVLRVLPAGRPVPTLVDTPWARKGARQSPLTLEQAVAVIAAAETLPVMELRPGLTDVCRPAALMYAYVVLSLLVGIRTEEARALRWDHVDLVGDLHADPPAPPHVAVWRAVRTQGETKTERSRPHTRPSPDGGQGTPCAAGKPGTRTAPGRGKVAGHRDRVRDHAGTTLDAGNVRKMFKRVCTAAGIGDDWTPRELRASFVSLRSHRGVSIEETARLVGHACIRTTEVVCRPELRPVITTDAEIMDAVLGGG